MNHSLTRALMTQRTLESLDNTLVVGGAGLADFFHEQKEDEALQQVMEEERDGDNNREEDDMVIDLRCHEDFDSDMEDDVEQLTPAQLDAMHLPKVLPVPTFTATRIDIPTNVGLDKLVVKRPRKRVAHKRPRKTPRRSSEEGEDPNLVDYFGRWPDLSAQSRIAIARTYANYLAACLRAENME